MDQVQLNEFRQALITLREEIGLGRLRIDPSATHCIGCADR